MVENKIEFLKAFLPTSVKDIDYSEFGELSFYVKDNLNFTFSFSHEELFYEYEGRKYRITQKF